METSPNSLPYRSCTPPKPLRASQDSSSPTHLKKLSLTNINIDDSALDSIAQASARSKVYSISHPKPFQHFFYWPSSAPASPKLRIFALTWNMYGNSPPSDLSSLLPQDTAHDLIAISSQECLRSISASLFYSSKKSWESQISSTLHSDYQLFATGSLGAMHLMIFVHVSKANQLSQPTVQTVSTGFGNLVSNKGAVGIKFFAGNTSLMFVACHLASGQNAVERRNRDFARIEKELLKELGSEPASSLVDACVYLGDFNYRTNGRKADVEHLISVNWLDALRIGDQLGQEMQQRECFEGFLEGKIEFAPSYKFDVGTERYDTSRKARVPSWTDRVLYKSRRVLKIKAYGSVENCFSSDHRPVFAQFSLRYAPCVNEVKGSSSRTCLVF